MKTSNKSWPVRLVREQLLELISEARNINRLLKADPMMGFDRLGTDTVDKLISLNKALVKISSGIKIND